MFGPFHRVGDPPEVVRQVLESGELRGRSPRNIFQSDIPKVKAYRGPLPDDATGFEFETDVEPDAGCVPDKPTWSSVPERTGVIVEGDYAKIRVRIRKQNVS